MRKFILLSLIGLLILAFGATVYAQKKEEPKLDFKASGFAEMCSFWNRNVPGLNAAQTIFGASSSYTTPKETGVDSKAYNRSVGYLDYRGHLKFDAVMGKELSGTIYFEMDSTRWGDTPGGQGGKLSERGTLGYWNTDRAAIEIKNLYFDVAIPYFGIPAPMTARIGAHALSIRPQLFVYTDAMGISGGIKADPVMIQPMWFKALEGTDYTADDVDVYGLHLNAKIDAITIGTYGLYYNLNTYPIFVSETQTDSGGDTLPTALNKLSQGTQRAEMFWWGFYADGKVGPVNINFDFILDDGKVESRKTPTAKDVDYSGWASRLKVDYPWEKFNFGVVGMYATGADMKKTDATGLPGKTVAYGSAYGESRKVGSYVVPPGSEAGPVFAGYFDSVVFYAINASSSGGTGWANGVNGNTMNRGPVGGTWYAKLYGSYKLTPDYKVTLQGLYIGDTTKNGNTFGTAVKPSGVKRDDKDIGWELDLINEIQLYKNLKWVIGAGILFAGDALDMKKSSGNVNDSPDNPWQITTRLTYSF
ncbi:MAG: hypothetical protein HXY46_01030 [Syntrophaceae bacterium]|nr:hypothetical protein [Syntrophaceae bacterium]